MVPAYQGWKLPGNTEGEEMDASIQKWIAGLSDDYLIQWANRGLFRRGNKLAEKNRDIEVDIRPDGIRADLGRCAQEITGVGFDHMSCSCPAFEKCHHLTALLVLLRDRFNDAERRDDSPPEKDENWHLQNPAEIRKTLGPAVIKKAKQLFMQKTPVSLDIGASELKAAIRARRTYNVVIPRAGGLKASVCTCKKEVRCVHRGLAFFQAHEEAGLEFADDVEAACLSERQHRTLENVKTWLRTLAVQGASGVSLTQIEQGEALATLLKNVDLPKNSRHLTAVIRWLKSDRGREASARPESLRYSLARIHAHVSALGKPSPPQPFYTLAGSHTRPYDVVHNLRLAGVGAEAWEAGGEYSGFTLYLYHMQKNVWHRLVQARPLSYIKEMDWSPKLEFEQGFWSGGPKYSAIPGSRITVVNGWTSPDGALSGREGTVVHDAEPLERRDMPPVYDDFASLAREYLSYEDPRLFSDQPPMPAIIRADRWEGAVFDPYRQRWTRTGRDRNGAPVRLRIDAQSHGAETIRAMGKKEFNAEIEEGWLFGLLSNEKGVLTLRPISISGMTPECWTHLSMLNPRGERSAL